MESTYGCTEPVARRLEVMYCPDMEIITKHLAGTPDTRCSELSDGTDSTIEGSSHVPDAEATLRVGSGRYFRPECSARGEEAQLDEPTTLPCGVV
jgi:hypothetical protein